MAADESYPDDLRYHREHDWARVEDGEALLGITWYAQDALGELVHYEPPAVSEIIAPLSGEVIEVNQAVVDAPETVNEDPYGAGWLIRIRLSEPGEADGLLDAASYREVVAEQ